ncbi:MAG: PPC domain-containing protein [Spirochaetes bacterium]|nr:PPC domain-containing protein [Spirochaetota bacterium]
MNARRLLACAALLAAVTAADVFAQTRPHIGYVYPAGGKRGETITIAVGGQFLESVTNFMISGSGIEMKQVGFTRWMEGFQIQNLKDRKIAYENQLAEFESPKASATGAGSGDTMMMTGDSMMMSGSNADAPVKSAAVSNASAVKIPPATNIDQVRRNLSNVIRELSYVEKQPDDPDTMKFMREMAKKKQPNVQLADTVKIEMTIAEDAAIGQHELRLATVRGVSEPLTFFVGSIPEIVEREPNDDHKKAHMLPAMPVIINGQILPGDVDRYRFSGVAGQKLAFVVQARELMPYLADAVPGWFQSVLTLYNAKGKEVAFADDFYINPDAVLIHEIKEDGEYVLEIRDSIYRGREDFVYRITAGALPYVTGISPIGGPRDAKTAVTLRGVNLPFTNYTVAPDLSESGVILLDELTELVHNPVYFYADDLREVNEREDNNTISNAQASIFPCAMNGIINKPGDIDIYKLSLKAGTKFVAEVYARRLGAPVDSMLKLTDARGTVLATNDDTVDSSMGLTTHHADSLITCTIPVDGTYYVTIKDMQNKGGELYNYRLRMNTPQPDFKLRVTPSSVSVPRGGTLPVTVHVTRHGGFDGAITLSLTNAPKELTISGGIVRFNNNTLRVTLSAAPTITTNQLMPHIVGTAMIDGREVSHIALPAEDMMQAFAYRHIVPSENFYLTCVARPRAALMIDTSDPIVSLRPGEEKTFLLKMLYGNVKVTAMLPKVRLQYELETDIPGMTLLSPEPVANTAPVLVVKTDPAIKKGLRGNIVVNAFVISGQQKDSLGRPIPQKQFLCTFPALPFEVVQQ